MPLQTNSSRAKTLDLHIAERVAAELASLQEKEDSTLASLREKLSSDSPDANNGIPRSRLLEIIPSVPAPGDVVAQEEVRQNQSSAKVFEELEKLKRGLDERKKVKDMPREVESAREDLVRCLRMNDRRPLDCWREVEAFRASVRMMEEDFIGRVL